VLLVDFKKLRNRNVHLVWAPNKVSLLQRSSVDDTLTCLVKINSIIDGVWNPGEGLSLFAVAKFLFLNFYLVSHDDVTCRQLHRLHHYRHDMELDDVLLFVVYSDAHVSALLDLSIVQCLVGDGLVVAH